MPGKRPALVKCCQPHESENPEIIFLLDWYTHQENNVTRKIEDLFNLIENQVLLGTEMEWTPEQLLEALDELKGKVRSALKQPDLMEIYYDSDFPRQLMKKKMAV